MYACSYKKVRVNVRVLNDCVSEVQLDKSIFSIRAFSFPGLDTRGFYCLLNLWDIERGTAITSCWTNRLLVVCVKLKPVFFYLCCDWWVPSQKLKTSFGHTQKRSKLQIHGFTYFDFLKICKQQWDSLMWNFVLFSNNMHLLQLTKLQNNFGIVSK